MSDSNLREIKVSSKEVYSGKLLHVYNDKVTLPNGRVAERDLIRHVGAVCVLPILDDERVIIERQYRYPTDEILLEIPAGKLDSKEENRLEAARRELKEETGYSAKEWISIGALYPTPAYSDEIITAYIAKGLEKGAQNLDEDEFIDVELIPLKTLVDDVMSGCILDAKTQIVILKAARLLSI